MRIPPLAAVLAALVLVAVAGCDGGPAADADPPETVDGMELVVYEDDRLSFAHPEGWDVEVAEGDEQRVRVELRDSGADHAEAVIEAGWPFVAAAVEADLERTVRMFGREPDEPEISDFQQRSIEVPGAEEALLESYVQTDWVIGEEIPART